MQEAWTEDAFLVKDTHMVMGYFYQYICNIKKGRMYSISNLETIAKAFLHHGFMNDCVQESLAFSKLIWILANHPEQRGWPILARLILQGHVRFYEMTTVGVEWAFEDPEPYEQFTNKYPDAAEQAAIPKSDWTWVFS